MYLFFSSAAGIPDFRSPGSGLYDNLQQYNLPHPQAIFEINYFRRNPKPFYALAKQLDIDAYKVGYVYIGESFAILDSINILPH